ncbi:hypothetical protein [Streptomyces sp. NPDC058457]|uniref:hypothetical protein n=1 Tax=Streptomyces sp. NPDC058457 TaxID=3346507 RepID=UPI0036604794
MTTCEADASAPWGARLRTSIKSVDPCRRTVPSPRSVARAEPATRRGAPTGQDLTAAEKAGNPVMEFLTGTSAVTGSDLSDGWAGHSDYGQRFEKLWGVDSGA